jgi:hypothetical protein
LRFGPSIWSAWQFETAAVPAQLGPAPSERPREPVLWSWQRRNDNRARATGRAVLPQPSWCAEKHAWRGLQAPDSPRFLAISPSPGGDASRSPRADHRANPGVVLVVRARWRARRHTHGKNAMPRRSRARVLHLPPLSKNGPVAGLLVCPRLLCGAWRAVPRTGEAIFADRTMGLEATVTHDDQSAVNAEPCFRIEHLICHFRMESSRVQSRCHPAKQAPCPAISPSSRQVGAMAAVVAVEKFTRSWRSVSRI